MVALSTFIFCLLLYGYFLFTHLPEKGFCSGCYSMGGCFCFCYCFYRYVADDEEKSRELVLVDGHKYCFYSPVLCKRICVYQCVLCGVACYVSFWLTGVGEKSKTISCIKKLSSSGLKAPAKAL